MKLKLLMLTLISSITMSAYAFDMSVNIDPKLIPKNSAFWFKYHFVACDGAIDCNVSKREGMMEASVTKDKISNVLQSLRNTFAPLPRLGQSKETGDSYIEFGIKNANRVVTILNHCNHISLTGRDSIHINVQANGCSY